MSGDNVLDRIKRQLNQPIPTNDRHQNVTQDFHNEHETAEVDMSQFAEADQPVVNPPGQLPQMVVDRSRTGRSLGAQGAERQYQPSKEAVDIPQLVERFMDIPTTIGGVTGGVVAAANSIILDRNCAQPIHGMYVNNYSAIWLYIEAAGLYIPPYWVGMSFPIPTGTEKVKVVAAVPAGITQGVAVATQTFSITATEARADWSSGQAAPASSVPALRGVSVPATSSPVLAATSGNAAAAAANIAANIVPANTVFVGAVSLALSASQNATIAAAGTSKIVISWVPGTGGTGASNVAEGDIQFGVGAATSTLGVSDTTELSVPVTVFAGTTAGTFQVAVIETGTISSRLWSCSVTGIAQ